MATRPTVTAVIVTWNSTAHIGECLETLLAQTCGPVSVVAVDSHSSDGTPEYIEKHFPSVEVVRSGTNLGYCAGNRLGMSLQSSDYIAVLNDDLALAPNALEILIGYMERKPSVALASPLVLMHSDANVVNTAGNRLSWCGMPSARGKGRSPQELQYSGAVAAIAGCAFVVRRAVLREIGGGFSEDFLRCRTGWHASLEDADLSLRAWIAGYEVHCVGEAVVFHRYSQRSMSPERWASVEYGRSLVLLRCFEGSTLLRIAPVLLAVEIAALGYSALRGMPWFTAKMGVMRWILTHGREIRRMRQAVQGIRKVRDREILPALDDLTEFSGSMGGGRGAQAMEKFLAHAMRGYRRIFLWSAPQAILRSQKR
jgi:GT2 family glycosyltransferase